MSNLELNKDKYILISDNYHLFFKTGFLLYLPLGEYTLRLIGILEMPLLLPVTLSVSASISFRTSSKSTNFLPLQCKNSAYSVT